MEKETSLKNKTINGLFWSMLQLIATQGVQFVTVVMLARLLVPEDFGIIGIITVFIAISNSIVDSGLSSALIREKEVTQEDYSTIFYFNLTIALVIYFILFFSAEFISNYFGEPQIISMLKLLGLVLILNSFTLVQRTMLTKRVDFKTQTIVGISSSTVSGIISIMLASFGYGVWSLVIQILLLNLIQSILLSLINRWRPSFVFNINSFKKYYKFGIKILISGLIDTIYKNIYFVIIGKVYSTIQVGYYTNAVKLSDVSTQAVTSSIQRVTYPVLSSLQKDEDRLKNGFKKVLKTSAFIIFPFMLGLASIAKPLVLLLFGEKWTESIIYFQLLCFAAMLFPLHALNLNVLQIKGRSDLFLYLEVIKKILLTILIVLSLWFNLGVIGLIQAAVLHSYLALVINTFFCAREISYSLIQQIKDLLPIFLTSIGMSCIVYLIGEILPNIFILKLIIQIISGILAYVMLCMIFKIDELNTVMGLTFSYLRKISLYFKKFLILDK